LPGRAEAQRNSAPKRDPIARPKLAELVQNRLLAVIQAENLRPGDFLPSERELMQSYAVGRPSIREAMQNLQRMGLIEINHGERPRMATPSFERMVSSMSETMRHVLVNSPTTLGHLKEARATFEMTMAQIAARKRTATDIEDLHTILREQDSARLDSSAFLEADGRFHHRIAIVSGNPIFASLSEALFAWLAKFHFDLVRKPGLEQLTLAEHGQILGAIERGEPDAAARLTADHLNRANTLYNQANFRP
jgi:GntR family transcriptional regulator, sialic acid-inducible nan operon repressor